jgi:fungal STAND N-terminal Goodbye domain
MREVTSAGTLIIDRFAREPVASLWAVQMATVGFPVESASVDSTSDIGAIWKEAIDRYQEIANVKVESLTRAVNVDGVLTETHKKEAMFKGYRHDETKLDRFRALVSRSLSPIEKVGGIVASAASVVGRQPLPAC